jgi:hypothetical protein
MWAYGIYIAAIIIAMLIVVCLSEGWMKGMIIFVSCLVPSLLTNLIMYIIGCDRETLTIINYSLGGIWAVGLTLYNILNRNIKNIRIDP